MGYLRSFVAIAVFVCSLHGPAASAEDLRSLGKLTKSVNSVTKVMQRAGCSRAWLSQVLEDSSIDATKLRRLPVGQEILLRKSSSCKNAAPARVANLSGILLRMDTELVQVENLRSELASMRDSVAASAKQLQDLALGKNKLAIMIIDLERQLADQKKNSDAALREAAAGADNARGFTLLLTAIVLALTVFASSAFLWTERNKTSFRSKWTVKSHGRKYPFVLAGVQERPRGSGVLVALYKCPLCEAYDVHGQKKGLIAHIETKHPDERVVVEVDPALQEEADSLRAR